jgi:AcrR family transcriptional regulator
MTDALEKSRRVRRTRPAGGAVPPKPPPARNTRNRILRAAVRVFAAHGYRGGTTRLICSEAGANLALANYHFRSKDALCRTVVGFLFGKTLGTLTALPDTVHDEAGWRLAVRTWVRTWLGVCAARTPPERWLARLLGGAGDVPPDVAGEIDREFKAPAFRSFDRLLSMALPGDDPLRTGLWSGAILAQCAVYALTGPGWPERFRPPDMNADAWLARVADHICADVFSRLSFRTLGG